MAKRRLAYAALALSCIRRPFGINNIFNKFAFRLRKATLMFVEDKHFTPPKAEFHIREANISRLPQANISLHPAGMPYSSIAAFLVSIALKMAGSNFALRS